MEGTDRASVAPAHRGVDVEDEDDMLQKQCVQTAHQISVIRLCKRCMIFDKLLRVSKCDQT